MTTKQMLREHLESKGAFTDNINNVILKAVDTISGDVPYRLKLSIAISELVTLTSHLRKHIVLYDGTLVPSNAIIFALSASGTAKDSSMNMVRKALSGGYEYINKIRNDEAKSKAEKMALLDGKKKEDWLAYYEKPKDLQAGLGTVEGIVKHFHDLETGSIGAGSINSSEIGSELLNNGNMSDIIKTLAIGYDLGKIPAKIIKSTEGQTASIESLPMSALFFGSQEAILYDSSIKNKFKTIFTTQLARRSLFSFTPEPVNSPNFTTISELTKYREEERTRTVNAQKAIRSLVTTIVSGTNQEPLPLDGETQELFDIYKEYNQLEANDMKSLYPINKLARRHKQWLALKLSGNYAVLDHNETVTVRNYIQALNTVEIFSDDLMAFEAELVKESYEVFAEFCKYNAEDGKYTISLHQLRKLGYIPTTGIAKGRIEELVHLASSYDQEAIYTACEEGICYEEQIKTSVAGLSYLPCTGTKEERGSKCASGFEFYETTFADLAGLLQEDFAYSPFHFKDGIRGKEHIISGTKFIALDIDKKTITDEECHLMLEGLNHHIARSSDGSNPFKFRVLIELDAVVDLDDRHWRYFIEEIAMDLGLEVDTLPKSQIFFSYEGREVLSCLDGDTLETRRYITESSIKLASKPKPTKLTPKAQQSLLDDPLETFNFSFNAEAGDGSRSLIRAALYARDLGATQKYILDLMDKINHYWSIPMDEDRLENTIKTQIRRMF